MSIGVLTPDRIPMSQKERDALTILHAVLRGERTQAEAARLLDKSTRQIRRILRRLQTGGDAALVHGLRGKPSNHQSDPQLRRAVLAAYRRRYADFGPTFASEKLAQEGLRVGPQTLRRWLIADVTTWYPVTDEPQRHFTNAVADYARRDYNATATEIRKATSYVRLEAGRATGEPKQELDRSVAQLDALAMSVEKGAVKDEHVMANVFAHADHALAVEHRAKATESWTRKDYDKFGYELKAAASGLESAAGWTGDEAKAAASATVAEARALGEKLASRSAWTRDEIAKGFAALDHSIDELGRKISHAT